MPFMWFDFPWFSLNEATLQNDENWSLCLFLKIRCDCRHVMLLSYLVISAVGELPICSSFRVQIQRIGKVQRGDSMAPGIAPFTEVYVLYCVSKQDMIYTLFIQYSRTGCSSLGSVMSTAFSILWKLQLPLYNKAACYYL